MERQLYEKRSGRRVLAILIVIVMLFAGMLAGSQPVFGDSAAANGEMFQKQEAPQMIITGKTADQGDGFMGNFKYLTKSDLESIKDEASAQKYFPSATAAYLKDKTYSARTKKEQGGWNRQTISGLDLTAVAKSLGIDTSQSVTVNTRGSDGHSSTISEAFTKTRYAFPAESSDVTQGTAVPVAIALIGTTESSELPRMVYGQTEAGDFNMQNWEKYLKYVWIGEKDYVLKLTINGQVKSYSLADIIGTNSGSYTSDYTYTENDSQTTVTATGIPLDKFLKDAGVSGTYTIKTASGRVIKDSSKYMLAYKGKIGTADVKASGQLILYGPGTTKAEVAEEGIRGFTVKVAAPGTVTRLKAVKNSYNSIKLTWSKASGAEGYNIYRYNSKTKKYSLLDCTEGISKTSFTDRGLNTGTKYFYKVTAYKTVSNLDLESSLSSAAGAIPTLDKMAIKLSRSGKTAIKAKWGKVSGASGYQLMVGTNSKITKGKKTYTIKKGSTRSKTVTKLKKGKRYYSKIRPYRTVSGKKIYGSYSAVRSIKR